MGRRRKHVRTASYQSLTELKDSAAIFDLSNVSFVKNARICTNSKAEVNITFVKYSLEDKAIRLSFRSDIGERILSMYGDRVTGGLVTQHGLSRYYLIKSSFGFKIKQDSGSTRYVVALPLGEGSVPEEYKPYEGSHSLQYDDVNNAVFIVSDR